MVTSETPKKLTGQLPFFQVLSDLKKRTKTDTICEAHLPVQELCLKDFKYCTSSYIFRP